MLTKAIRFGAASALAVVLASPSWAQTWTVNFKDSEIQEVIKFVADVTGRTVVIDPRVKGRVKVMSSKPLNEDELISLFRTVLEVHDFSLVEVGDVLRIIPLKDTRSSPVPVVDDEMPNKRGYVTTVIQLQNIAAAKVLPSIRPLVPQHSHLSAYDPSNAIIITDSAENIERIRSLIEQLDKSATPVTEVVELRYANAQELVQVFNSLENQQGQNNNQGPNNSLNLTADKRNNAILVTGEDLQRERIKNLIAKLDKPRTQSGNVRVVYLDYADAKTAAETLTKVMANLSKLGPGGGNRGGEGGATAATVEADEDTNALLITAAGDELETLLEVVERIDIRRAQVLVEAIIAEVADTDGSDLGIQWLFQNSENGTFASSSQGANGGLGAIGAGAIGLADTENDDALTQFAGALASTVGQVLGVVGTNEDDNFIAILKALQTNSKSNILSTPSLLTMDNHEASFTAGENIPIVTGSTQTAGGLVSPFTTVQREDVGIKLTLTPQINEGNTILLDIQQENSSVLDRTPEGFRTSKRAIQTKVLASDGEIVVLGGLIEDKQLRNEQRVPILGSIPVLGRLFRTEGKNRDRTNLMVFLKVSIIRDDKALSGATAEKYEHIRREQMRQRNNGFLRRKDKDLNLLPDMTFYDLQKPLPNDPDVIKTPGAEAAFDSDE